MKFWIAFTVLTASLLASCASAPPRDGRVENQFFVERRIRQRARIGAGRDDDVLALERFVRSTRDGNFIAIRIGFHERAAAMEKADLVLLEQVQNAVIVLLDHAILAAHHLREVELDALDLDTMLGHAVMRVLIMLGRLQHRF